MKEIGGGKTYSELSSQLLTEPNNAQLAKTVQTLFQGETLRGLLLNAWAFWTIGSIAAWAALAAFIGAGLRLILSIVGLLHSGRVGASEELLAPRATA